MAAEVKVRLSAEGQQAVVGAIRRVGTEGEAAGRRTAAAFNSASTALRSYRGLLPALSAAAAIAGIRRLAQASLDLTDRLDENARSLGVTTDFLQEAEFAARDAGTPVEALSQMFAFMERRIADTAAAGEPFLEFMDGATIASRNADGSTRGFRDVLNDLLKIFPELKKGVEQNKVAVEVFGRGGREAINFLSLGVDGFARLANQAHATGAVLDKDVIEKGGRVNDALEQLRENLLKAFAEGLLDGTIADLEDIHRLLSDSSLTDNLRSAGQATQGLLRFLEFIADNSSVLVPVLTALAGARFGLIGAAVGLGAGIGGVAAFRQRAAQPRDRRRIITGEPVNALEPNATGHGGLVDPGAEARAEAARRKAEAAAAKAAREAKQLAEEQQRAREATDEFEARLLEQQGKRHEAALAALDLELEKYRENLETRGDLDQAEIDRRVEQARSTGEQLAEFEEAQRQANAAFDELAARRLEIQEQVARGQISEQEGEAKILQLDRDRLEKLEEILAKITAIAQASGDPELIERANQLAASVSNVRVAADKAGREMAEFRKEFADAAENEVAQFFEDILTGTKSVDDAFKDLVKSIANQFLSLIAKKLAEKLFESLLGGSSSGGTSGGGIISSLLSLFGGATKKAAGGYISGPGTSTSDSIPAWLSDGEFVVNAKSTAKARDLLELINRGFDIPPITPRRYASGGFVSRVDSMARDLDERRAAGQAGAGANVFQLPEKWLDVTFRDAMESYIANQRHKVRRR